jgi:hypothetical protein
MPVDMWTIGQARTAALPTLTAQEKGAESVEMLAFAHIPTGNRNNKKE